MRLAKVTIGAILALSLAACTDEINPCGVNPTITNMAGECIEADGEVCDDDPCDADEFDESDKHKKPTPKIPVRRRH